MKIFAKKCLNECQKYWREIILFATIFLFSLIILASFLSSETEWIKNYQTLISGMIALLAAAWTVHAVRAQIMSDQNRHEEVLKRKAWAARAQMPDALSQLVTYAENCFRYIQDLTLGLPDPPSEAIAVFKNCIEFIDTSSAQKIYEMVSFYQVHNSRLQSMDRNSAHEMEDRIHDVILLNYYFLRTFKYGRDEEEFISKDKPNAHDMHNSLKTLIGIDHYFRNEKTYASFNAIIDKYYQ